MGRGDFMHAIWEWTLRRQRTVTHVHRIGTRLLVCLAPLLFGWLWFRLVLRHAPPGMVYVYLLMAGAAVGGPALVAAVAEAFLGEDRSG